MFKSPTVYETWLKNKEKSKNKSKADLQQVSLIQVNTQVETPNCMFQINLIRLQIKLPSRKRLVNFLQNSKAQASDILDLFSLILSIPIKILCWIILILMIVSIIYEHYKTKLRSESIFNKKCNQPVTLHGIRSRNDRNCQLRAPQPFYYRLSIFNVIRCN